MRMEKYELLENDTININGHILYRIKAIVDIYETPEDPMDFDDFRKSVPEQGLFYIRKLYEKYKAKLNRKKLVVKSGTLGGYVESEFNLSDFDGAWIGGNATVFEDAEVEDNALVYGNAKVHGNAKISCNSKVFGDAEIRGNATISDHAKVYRHATIRGKASISGHAQIYGHALITHNAEVYGQACVYGHAMILNSARVYENAVVRGIGKVYDGNVRYHDIVDDFEVYGDCVQRIPIPLDL